MLERLLMRFTSSEKYLDVFVATVFFTLISVFLVNEMVLFQVGGANLGGVIAVLLTSLAVSYPFVRYLLNEEEMEISEKWGEEKLLMRHGHELLLYLTLFVGVTVGFAISSFFVPESFFSIQMQVLEAIRGPTGAVASNIQFLEILRNNLRVFFLTFILAFSISAGIIFILVWNASVLGVLIGTLSSSAAEIPLHTFIYMVHGAPEIGAYVLAGIGGSILSYRVEAEFSEEELGDVKEVALDVVVIMCIGLALLVLGAGLEAAPLEGSFNLL